ncbi:MAG: T9SS type B sorting domain-containing protein, partial [Gelidibacter sp.]
GKISICENTPDGYAIVDLTSEINNIVSDTNGLKISYYKNSNLAVAGDKGTEISDPTKYRSSGFKYIAVRIENELGCFSIGAIYIYVNSPPQFTTISNFQNCTSDGNSISDFYFYQKDEEILNGQIGKEVLYFETEADAQDRVNMIDKNLAFRNTPTISQTIYVRMEAANDPTCYATSSFVLEVDNLPPFNEATDVFLCDDLSDNGVVTYDLRLKEQEIKKDIAQSIIVTFYTSNADAKDEVNPITDLNFTNTSNPQSIYARIDNGSFCHSMTSFSINVVPLPKAEAPSELYFCDTNLSGQGIFDVEVVKILDLRPEGIVITYHESLEGAETDTEIILDPKNYISTSSLQIVYAKIKNTLPSDACFITLPINLNIASPPTVNDFKEYSICQNPDNSFNLDAIDSKLSGESNILITYFSTRSDAIANDITTALDSNYTYNSPNDRIYVRLENTITGCISYYDFELVVTPLPIANKPIDLQGCDDDYDGVLVFDLSYEKTAEILGTQSSANYAVTYHETLQAANDGTPILNNLYGAADLQIIYVRVSNTDTGCFSTTQFSTIVHPKPMVNIPDQAICSDNPSSSVLVNAETNISTDTYLWSTGETTSEIEISAIGSYSVTVTGDFGCQTTTDFNVLTFETATIEFVETVDFSDPNNIVITISGNGNYLYILDDGPPQESNVFKNVTLGYHTVTVIDAVGCTETSKEVIVIDTPKFMTPNDDGYFDTWHISGVETLPGTVIYIYDRYGKQLAYLTSTSQGWDGTHNGHKMPASDYWFVADVKKDNKSFQLKGHFALKR